MRQYLLSKTESQKLKRPARPKFRASAGRTVSRAFRDPSLLALSVAFAMMLFFSKWPNIDLDVSLAFWSDGFRLGEDRFLVSVRDLNRVLPSVLLPGLVCVLFAVPFSAGFRRVFRPHKLLLILTFYALGPGATVHLLKSLFARARPQELGDFGGNLFFTPVLSFDGACARSCSFPSGESSTAIALLAFTILLPKKLQLISAATLMPFIVIFSLNRVAMGAHFLSDVLIAWPLMLAVFLSLHRLFSKHRHTIDAVFSRRVSGPRQAAG